MTTFQEYLTKSTVQRPGSKGGHGYYTPGGEWVYGDPPAGYRAGHFDSPEARDHALDHATVMRHLRESAEADARLRHWRTVEKQDYGRRATEQNAHHLADEYLMNEGALASKAHAAARAYNRERAIYERRHGRTFEEPPTTRMSPEERGQGLHEPTERQPEHTTAAKDELAERLRLEQRGDFTPAWMESDSRKQARAAAIHAGRVEPGYWDTPEHNPYMKSFRDYLAKSENVQHPGSRGGHYWVDKHGQVRYGTPPTGEGREHALAILRERVTTALLSNNVRWAFLTAFRKSRSHVQNLKLNAQLFRDLHARGARVLSCTGFYTYHDDAGKQQTTREPAFLALGLGPQDAIALGHKYDQESILSHEGFFKCNTPQRTPITSKRVIDDEIKKDADQSVIYLPDRNLTFLVDGAWDSPEVVPDSAGLYPHLRGDVAKSFNGGEGGYTAPAPPSSNMSLIAAEINLESAL